MSGTSLVQFKVGAPQRIYEPQHDNELVTASPEAAAIFEELTRSADTMDTKLTGAGPAAAETPLSVIAVGANASSAANSSSLAKRVNSASLAKDNSPDLSTFKEEVFTLLEGLSDQHLHQTIIVVSMLFIFVLMMIGAVIFLATSKSS